MSESLQLTLLLEQLIAAAIYIWLLCGVVLFLGLPIVLLEAMACGLPVIASAVGAVPRLVKNQQTGVLIDAANEAQLLRATRGLLQDEKLRSDLSQAARENVVNNFSIRATSDEYLKSYQHVLTQSFNE